MICSTRYLWLSAIVLLDYISFVHTDLIDQFFRQGKTLIADSSLPGAKVRQCSCVEQEDCLKEMQAQAMGCVDTCWSGFNKITSKPQELKKCFSGTDHLVKDFMMCFSHSANTCVDNNPSAMIQKLDLNKFFNLGFQRIQTTLNQLSKRLAPSLRKIISTSGNFTTCQLQLADAKLKGQKTCTRMNEWKNKGGQLCDCSTQAGLVELKQYCPMLHAISNKKNAH
uniref:Uncharacterized protein n=1 Tax=Ditylenchus dipsaci TaxID=166011 RepID=A0A915CNQ5_9BILA